MVSLYEDQREDIDIQFCTTATHFYLVQGLGRACFDVLRQVKMTVFAGGTSVEGVALRLI